MTTEAFLHAVDTDPALHHAATLLHGDLDALLSLAAQAGHDIDGDALRAAIERDTGTTHGHPAVYLV